MKNFTTAELDVFEKDIVGKLGNMSAVACDVLRQVFNQARAANSLAHHMILFEDIQWELEHSGTDLSEINQYSNSIDEAVSAIHYYNNGEPLPPIETAGCPEATHIPTETVKDTTAAEVLEDLVADLKPILRGVEAALQRLK